MIEITREPNADSRSAKEALTLEALTKATDNHIQHVGAGMQFVADLIVKAGEKHDNTKTSMMKRFHAALTGGDVKNSDWYKTHIDKERHHLKSKCPEDVNLIDVIEAVVDCCMAGLSRSGEIYDVDIDPRILEKAVANTVELIKKNTKVKDAPKDLMDTKIDG